MSHIRVRDKATGHEYTILERQFIPEGHVRLDKPALHPRSFEPLPVKYRTTVDKAAAKKSATPKTPAAAPVVTEMAAESADQPDNIAISKES